MRDRSLLTLVARLLLRFSTILLVSLTTSRCSAIRLYNKNECNPGPHSIDPSSSSPIIQAPDTFQVVWKTTASESTSLTMELYRDWAPLGVDRFYNLILDGYFDCAALFRVVPNFVVQFGIASEPAETKKWDSTIPDDPVIGSNTIGTVTFAMAGANTRTTQVFVNLQDNVRLDHADFAPIGRIVEGLEVLQHDVYNPTPGDSGGVSQGKYERGGNEWILKAYPEIDLIESAVLVPSSPDTVQNNNDKGSFGQDLLPELRRGHSPP